MQPLYTLVTAGESLHWMDWAVALPRLAAATAFDQDVRQLLSNHAEDGRVRLQIAATVIWGIPIGGSPEGG